MKSIDYVMLLGLVGSLLAGIFGWSTEIVNEGVDLIIAAVNGLVAIIAFAKANGIIRKKEAEVIALKVERAELKGQLKAAA